MFINNHLHKGNFATLRLLQHDLLLNFSEESLFKGTNRTLSELYFELPFPIFKPSTTDCDEVKRLVEDKNKYNKVLQAKRMRFKADKRIISKEKVGDKKFAYIPRHLIDFYKMKDPDEYFNCDYNFYYTGGVLEYIEYGNKRYLISARADNRVRFLNIDKCKRGKKDFLTNSTIYNISSFNISDDSLLLIREKLALNVVPVGSMLSSWRKEFSVPIFDSKFTKSEHVGFILADSTFTIRNIETKKKIYRFVNDTSDKCDNFQQFYSLAENVSLLMDRSEIRVLDMRQKMGNNVFRPNLIDCNSLCNLTVLDNSLLLSTRHYLLNTDLRYLKDVTYYTHSLKSPPLYIDYTTDETDTYLCLTGQNVEDQVLFTGHSPYSIPFKIPNVLDTLKETSLKHPSLILKDHIKNRLYYSLAGMKILNTDNNICLYTVNSLGDIFKAKISNTPCDNTQSEASLLKWSDRIEPPEPILHLSHVEELSRLMFSLDTTAHVKDIKKETGSHAEDFLSEYLPRYSMNSAKGSIAKNFLTIWHDDDDDDGEEADERLPEVPVHDKVNDWIKTHDFSDNEDSFSYLSFLRNNQ